MATKVEKKNRKPLVAASQESKVESKFYDEDLLKEVADVASSERQIPDSIPVIQTIEPIKERAVPVRGNVGRKPKERKIRRDYPKTIYFDEPTSMKLSDVRTKDKIEIKDLVLVATIEFLNRNFNNETRSLNEAAKNYIRKEMDRILDTFSE